MQTHIKETSKSALLALCEENLPVTGEFSAQTASNAEKASIWCHHHGKIAWFQQFQVPVKVENFVILPEDDNIM